jgi:carbohydrate diacid regulator
MSDQGEVTTVDPPPDGLLPDALRRQRNRFIFDLLHGIVDSEEEVVEKAQKLNMDLSQPRAVLLVDASDYALGSLLSGKGVKQIAGWRSRTHEVIAAIVSFFMLPHEAICADIGDGVIAVLKASNSRNLDAWADEPSSEKFASPSWANLTALKRAANDLLARLTSQTGESINIGIGRYHPGVAGIAASFGDARAALLLGRRLNGPNRVHCLDDLGIGAFVGIDDERTKIDLAYHLLSPLDHEEEVLETLYVFFDSNCSPALTSQRLGIHRNTLAYRLSKVASVTGLDPRRFDDAVQIRLAMVLRGLATHSTPPSPLTVNAEIVYHNGTR